MGNRRKIKHGPSVLEQLDDVIDTAIKTEVKRRYDQATKQWRNELEAEQDRQREQLNNPAYLTELGLPVALPPESLDILKVTMALDTVGPKMPKISTFAEKFGL